MITYTRGLTLKTERIITKDDIITMCKLLNSKDEYSNLCEFQPEPISEGGIVFKFNNLDNESVKDLKDKVLANVFNEFGKNEFEYIFNTDADTIVDKNAIICLLDSVEKRNAIASCGVVNVDKSKNNWFWNN